MSALSETIQYTQMATSDCQEIVEVLTRAAELLADVERALRAGLDGTQRLTEISQYHRLVGASLTDTRQAVQRFNEQLEGLVAQFQQAA